MADTPSSLRDRAYHLRRSALRLDEAAVFGLRSKAGSDTWIGPTASAYRETVVSAESAIRQAVEALRSSARQLVRRADLLEEEQRRRDALLVVRS